MTVSNNFSNSVASTQIYPDPELWDQTEEQSELWLPTDVWLSIFSLLPPKEWCKKASVSNAWNKLLSDDRLWKRLVKCLPEIAQTGNLKEVFRSAYIESTMSNKNARELNGAMHAHYQEQDYLILRTRHITGASEAPYNAWKTLDRNKFHVNIMTHMSNKKHTRMVMVFHAGTMKLVSAKNLEAMIKTTYGPEALADPKIQNLIENFKGCLL